MTSRRMPRQARMQRLAQRRLGPVATPVNSPAPYGGLNLRDSLDAMAPNQAIRLNNWFPSEGEVEVREGYIEAYDTGETGETIRSMHNFKAGAFDQLIIGVDGRLYEAVTMTKATGTDDSGTANHLTDGVVDFAAAGVTTNSIAINTDDGTYAGVTVVALGDLTLDADIFALGDAYAVTTPVATGFSDDDWDADNFDGELMLVNGVDQPKRWNGTALSNNSWTGTGLTATDLSVVTSFKNRVFYATGDDQSFWYADVIYTKTGTLIEFPLGRIGAIKGNVIAMSSWTVDGGDGIDDYFVIATAGGQLVVYQGLDPGSAINWALVGIYEVSLPVNGRNCLKKVGTDLMYLSVDDVTPLRMIMAQGYVGQRTLVSGGIREEAAQDSGAGWQMLLAPEGRKFIINLPNSGASGGYNQYVQNTITGAWARWVDIPSPCWEGFLGASHFGSTDGKAYKLSGNSDAGSGIEAEALMAYNEFGTPAEKHVTAIRPVLASQGSELNYNVGIAYDYTEPTVLPAAVSTLTGTPWGSPWGSSWDAETTIKAGWRAAGGKGSKLATKLAVTAVQKIAWLETDYRLQSTTNL